MIQSEGRNNERNNRKISKETITEIRYSKQDSSTNHCTFFANKKTGRKNERKGMKEKLHFSRYSFREDYESTPDYPGI